MLALIDFHHQGEALRRPLGMLGALWVEGAQYGARKINGSFNAKGRIVRYKRPPVRAA